MHEKRSKELTAEQWDERVASLALEQIETRSAVLSKRAESTISASATGFAISMASAVAITAWIMFCMLGIALGSTELSSAMLLVPFGIILVQILVLRPMLKDIQRSNRETSMELEAMLRRLDRLID